MRFAAVSWHCLPASSNWFSLSGGGLCDSSAPNVGGPQTAPVSCFESSKGTVSMRYVPVLCPSRCQLQEGRRDLACSIDLKEDSLGIEASNRGLSEVSS